MKLLFVRSWQRCLWWVFRTYGRKTAFHWAKDSIVSERRLQKKWKESKHDN